MKKLFLLAALVLPAYLNGVTVEVSDINQFNLYINQEAITVVKFYANWCSPCKQLNPLYIDLENRYGVNTSFLTVNIDRATAIKNKYGANKVPFVAIFKNGQILNKLLGLRNIRSQLENLIKQYTQA